MKPGSKLCSTVCDTEVMLIRYSQGRIECGGAPMAEEKTAATGTPDAAFAAGSLIGKRYVDADATLELLCVKPGAGSLSVDGVALQLKEAKPLPSSD